MLKKLREEKLNKKRIGKIKEVSRLLDIRLKYKN